MKSRTYYCVLTAFWAAALLGGSAQILAAKKASSTVAVVDFHNNTGSEGLKFLGRSLTEQVSSALARGAKLRVIERTQFGKVLQEIELMQTGIMDGSQSTKDLKLAAAQYLVVGTYSGSSAELLVQLKAVEVATGSVVGAREEKGPVEEIVSRMQIAGDALQAAMLGSPTGTLSVTSEPSGAVVLVDGARIGETPVFAYQLTSGRHNIQLSKTGRKSHEANIDIAEGESKVLEIALADRALHEAFYIALSGTYILPQSSSVKNKYAMGAEFGYRWRQFAAELQFRWLPIENHDYTFLAPYNTLTQKRTHSVMKFAAGLQWHPFDFTYVSPYAALAGGAMVISDQALDSPYNADMGRQTLFFGAAGAGITLFPYSKISLFGFVNYVYTPGLVDRDIIRSINFFGSIDRTKESQHYAAVEVGLGLRFSF